MINILITFAVADKIETEMSQQSQTPEKGKYFTFVSTIHFLTYYTYNMLYLAPGAHKRSWGGGGGLLHIRTWVEGLE